MNHKKTYSIKFYENHYTHNELLRLRISTRTWKHKLR